MTTISLDDDGYVEVRRNKDKLVLEVGSADEDDDATNLVAMSPAETIKVVQALVEESWEMVYEMYKPIIDWAKKAGVIDE